MRVLLTLLKIIGGIAILVAPAMLALYFLFDPHFPPLDQAAREDLSRTQTGSFTKLSDGVTYYQWHGDVQGEKIVLVHGFMIPSFVFISLTQSLVQEGYRVLTYDQFGRGFSDRPDTDYDAELLDRQLTELMDTLEITRTHLMGYSMGGALATIFAAHHPERIQSLTLIAPVGLAGDGASQIPLLTRLFLSPGIGDWAVQVLGPSFITKHATSGFSKATDPADMGKRFLMQTRYDGYSEALLSILRFYPLEGSAKPSFQEVGRLDIPVLLLWGEDDAQVPVTAAPAIQNAIPQSQLNTYSRYGHEIAYAGVHSYSPALLTFLAENTPQNTREESSQQTPDSKEAP